MIDPFLSRHQKLTGVQGRYLTSTSSTLVAESSLTDIGEELLARVGVVGEEPAAVLSEAFARQTYLAYPEERPDPERYLGKLLQELGHRSIVNAPCFVHFVSGLTIPAATHLIQAGAKIGRLTTSNTKAQTHPLYRLLGPRESHSLQQTWVEKFLELKERYRGRTQDPELWNLCDLVQKTVSLFHSGRAKEYYSVVTRLMALTEVPGGLDEVASSWRQDYEERFPDRLQGSRKSGPAPTSRYQLEAEQGRFITNVELEMHPGEAELRQVIDIYGERLEGIPVTFDIHGLAQETILEFASHSEATVQPLPSPWRSEEFYRIQGDAAQQDWQRDFVRDFLVLREEAPRELRQLRTYSPFFAPEMFELGIRASSCRLRISLGDLHCLLIGRLSPHGNERDVQSVCLQIASRLHAVVPQVIKPADVYYQMGNQEKLDYAL